jgi:hypothetical protein
MRHDPDNYHDIKSALKEAGREDLIGTGGDCLIAPYPPKSVSMRQSSRVRRLQKQNEKGKKQKEERRTMFAEKLRQEDMERLQKKREEKNQSRQRKMANRSPANRNPKRKIANQSPANQSPPRKQGTKTEMKRSTMTEKTGGRKPAGKPFGKAPKRSQSRSRNNQSRNR